MDRTVVVQAPLPSRRIARLPVPSMTVSASGCVPMRRSTRYVVVLACTAAVAVAVEVPALSLHIINAEGAVTSASRPGGRSPGGAADAVGRRDETAVVDFRQVESDASKSKSPPSTGHQRSHRCSVVLLGARRCSTLAASLPQCLLLAYVLTEASVGLDGESR